MLKQAGAAKINKYNQIHHSNCRYNKNNITIQRKYSFNNNLKIKMTETRT